MIRTERTLKNRYKESECGRLVRQISDRLKNGHLYNAAYLATELQQAILREIGKIRHGEQTGASWLEAERQAKGEQQ